MPPNRRSSLRSDKRSKHHSRSRHSRSRRSSVKRQYYGLAGDKCPPRSSVNVLEAADKKNLTKIPDQTHEINLKKKMDNISKSHVKASQEKEKQDIDNLKKRERELLQSSSQTADDIKQSLDHYISLKVKSANIMHVRDETLRKLETYEKTRMETESEIRALDAAFPEYAAQVLPTFKKSLEEVGIKDTPLLKYLEASAPLANVEEEDEKKE